jgi:amidohydrolase family protein
MAQLGEGTSAFSSFETLPGVIDLDSHEMIPMPLWAEAFGQEAVDLYMPLIQGAHRELAQKRMGNANNTIRDDVTADLTPINYDTVWKQKGPEAPSSINFSRRPEVMDEMGIKRQFVFPSFGITGMNLYYNPAASAIFGLRPGDVDQQRIGKAMMEGYNGWAEKVMRDVDGERLRPVGIICERTVSEFIDKAQALISRGLRALYVPAVPPAGTSPADRALDPLWSLCEQRDVPVVLHLGSEFGFFEPAWYANVPEFSFGYKDSVEFPVEPFRASALHFPLEAFLAAMIFGGVFERFPQLRMGVIECGSHWLAPLAHKLDLWAGQFTRRLGSLISLKPSEYIACNVRVTPFHFEPFDDYIEQNPHLASVYCYSTDYPHLEGGTESKRHMYDRIQRLGPKMVEKFFVGNGEWLLPD